MSHMKQRAIDQEEEAVSDSIYPRVIWQKDIPKRGEYRIVQTAKGAVTPEHRLPNDCMGATAWQYCLWESWWLASLGEDYVELLKKESPTALHPSQGSNETDGCQEVK